MVNSVAKKVMAWLRQVGVLCFYYLIIMSEWKIKVLKWQETCNTEHDFSAWTWSFILLLEVNSQWVIAWWHWKSVGSGLWSRMITLQFKSFLYIWVSLILEYVFQEGFHSPYFSVSCCWHWALSSVNGSCQRILVCGERTGTSPVHAEQLAFVYWVRAAKP